MQASRPRTASVAGGGANDAGVASRGASVTGWVASTSVGGPLAAVTVVDARGASHEYLCGIGHGHATRKLLTWTLERWSAAHVVVTVDVDLRQRLGTIHDGDTRIWVDVYACL